MSASWRTTAHPPRPPRPGPAGADTQAASATTSRITSVSGRPLPGPDVQRPGHASHRDRRQWTGRAPATLLESVALVHVPRNSRSIRSGSPAIRPAMSQSAASMALMPNVTMPPLPSQGVASRIADNAPVTRVAADDDGRQSPFHQECRCQGHLLAARDGIVPTHEAIGGLDAHQRQRPDLAVVVGFRIADGERLDPVDGHWRCSVRPIRPYGGRGSVSTRWRASASCSTAGSKVRF